MERYSVTRGRAKVYRIMLEERSGWADITIESHFNGGSLKAISDFGDYNCIWTNTGPIRPFEEFLCGLTFEYFMEKTSIQSFLIFDIEKTVRDIKRDISNFRREKVIDRDRARLLFDNIGYCLDRHFDSFEDFLDYIEDIGLAEDFCVDGLYNYHFPSNYKYDEQCLAFWEIIWPCFCDALKRETSQDRIDFY